MRIKYASVVFVISLSLCMPAFAQTKNPLVGTWDIQSTYYAPDGKITDLRPQPDGKMGVATPPISGITRLPARAIFTADGHYVLLAIPKGRKPASVPGTQWPVEVWREMYGIVTGNYGTYSIVADKVTIKIEMALSPQNENSQVIRTMRKEGAELILDSARPDGFKHEWRMRPVK